MDTDEGRKDDVALDRQVAILEAEREQLVLALRQADARDPGDELGLFEDLPLGLYRATLSGRLIRVNAALVQILRYPDRDALLAIHERELFVRKADWTHVRKALEDQTDLRDFETPLRCSDGTIAWARMDSRYILDALGAVLYHEVTVRDITPRKAIEGELARHREHLEDLVRERTQEVLSVNELLLIEISERKRVEQQLRVRNTELSALNALAAAVSQFLDRGEVLAAALDTTLTVLGAEGGGIFLLRESDPGAVSHGFSSALERNLPRAVRVAVETFDLRTWEEKQFVDLGIVLMLAPNTTLSEQEQATRLAKWRSAHTDSDTDGLALGIPVVAKGDVSGVLVLVLSSDGRMQALQAELLRNIGHQIGVAIENARLFEEVRLAKQRLQALSNRLVEIQEAERRYIACELHDEIGQYLTGLKLILEMSRQSTSAGVSASGLEESLSLVDELVTRVRDLSLDLRPAMLDDLGLLPTLLWHFERYTNQTSVRVSFKHAGVENQRFAPMIETAAYRVIQEALTNVARYADVDMATVHLWRAEETLHVQVEDHGCGFVLDEVQNGASGGLSGMAERVALLGGKLTVISDIGQGTCLTAEFPFTGAKVQQI